MGIILETEQYIGIYTYEWLWHIYSERKRVNTKLMEINGSALSVSSIYGLLIGPLVSSTFSFQHCDINESWKSGWLLFNSKWAIFHGEKKLHLMIWQRYSPLRCVLTGEATITNFVVSGWTRPGLEPTIYRTRGGAH